RPAVGAEEQLIQPLVEASRQRRAERTHARGQRASALAADAAPESGFRFAQPACRVLAARVAGLRMSSRRTDTRCDEPLSSRWMPYSVDAYDIVTWLCVMTRN